MEDLLCQMETTSLDHNENIMLYQNLHLLEICEQSGADFDENIARTIKNNFLHYIESINWKKGPEEAVAAKGYIEFYLEETDIQMMLFYALKVHQLLTRALEKELLSQQTA